VVVVVEEEAAAAGEAEEGLARDEHLAAAATADGKPCLGERCLRDCGTIAIKGIIKPLLILDPPGHREQNGRQ
jgi:hypothetical protein